MTLLTRGLAFLLLAAPAAGLTTAQPPKPIDAGKMSWKEGYPKVVPAQPGKAEGSVELFGEVTAKPGWTVLEKAVFSYSPVGGGLNVSHDLVVHDGKWGVLNPKDKTKLVPAVFPIKKGKYHLRPSVTFEGTDAAGKPVSVTVVPPVKDIEVKEEVPDI